MTGNFQSAFIIQRKALPPLLEVVRRFLGLTLPREDSLLVSVHTHDPFHGLEIRKVPYLLPFHALIGIEYPVEHLQIFHLIFRAPLHAGQLVLSLKIVAPVLGEHHRAVHSLGQPCVHLLPERCLRVHHLITSQQIPPVVAVQAQKVAELVALAVLR